MMSLPWKNISWDDFELLTLHYAENRLPGTRFDDHLKQGSRQSGIDLIARSQSTDQPVCIQCKKKAELTPAKVKELVQTFLDDKYAVAKTRFILATTADLHLESIVAVLEAQQRLLKKKYDIEFEWWDEQTMANHLLQMWPLVERFFGIDIARNFCAPAIQRNPLTPPLDPVLPRGMLPLQHDDPDPIRQLWRAAAGPPVNLTELFTADRLEIRRVGLIADPYLGKSVYLRQCAYDLANAGQHIDALFIEVKQANVEAIDVLLTRRYREWESQPLKNLVVIIDGLDEAHGNDVLGMIKHVDEFTAQYPSVSIIVSCRRPFYDHYQLSARLKGFQFYTFSPLQMDDVHEYVRKRFDGHPSRFNKAIARKDLDSWLQHPFYLNQLIEEFQRSGHLTKTKTRAIGIFIEHAYKQGQDRSFGKDLLAARAVESRLATQKLAIILQLLEQNTLDNEQYQQLFSLDERQLLQHNPLVTLREGRRFFTNTFFQEHLAALQLRAYPSETIRGLISVGSTRRKLKTRWMQTTFALLSLLDDQPALRTRITELLEADSPELIFASEPTIYTPAFRVACLNRLITYCAENRMWPQLVYPEKIGQFLASTPEAIAVLFRHIEDANFPNSIKIVCCRILAGIPDINQTYDPNILELVHGQLDLTTDARYAAELIGILAVRELGTKKDVQVIMSKESFHRDHAFRSRMYEWIAKLTLQPFFWTYAIEGIPVLIAHNKTVSQSGSERTLEAYLLSFTNRTQLYSLFAAIRTEEWAAFYRYKGTLREGFVHKLLEKCADLIGKDPLFALPVADFLQHNGRRYLQNDLTGLHRLLAHPAAHDLLARCFGEKLFIPHHWELGSLINKQTLDYLLWEFEESALPFRALKTPLMALEKVSEKEAKTYERIIHDVSRGTLINRDEIRTFKKMQQVNEQRIELDMTCIQSRDAFREAIKRLFSIHRSASINIHDLYADRVGKKYAAASHFITQFIHHWIAQGEKASLADCLDFLEKEDNFRFFRAVEILQYQYEPTKTQPRLLPLLQEFYDTELPRCDFSKAAANTIDEPNDVERPLASIFSKYRFLTPPGLLVELLWMDTNGFIPSQTYNPNPDLLRTQIREALGNKASTLLADAVMDHLQQGIDAPGVLATHFDLCDKLGITESQPHLLEAVAGRKLGRYDLPTAVDIYLRLGGDKSRLLPILNGTTIDEPLFAHLLEVLAHDFPTKVGELALAAVNSGQLPSEENIPLAKIAAGTGAIAGFKYLVDLLGSPITSFYLTGVTFINIDTSEALALLYPSLYMLADGNYSNRALNNPRGVVQEWLKSLAAKSEQDLHLVLKTLQQAEQQLKERYPDAIDLRWYAFQMEEKLRDMQAAPYSIEQIKAFLAAPNVPIRPTPLQSL